MMCNGCLSFKDTDRLTDRLTRHKTSNSLTKIAITLITENTRSILSQSDFPVKKGPTNRDRQMNKRTGTSRGIHNTFTDFTGRYKMDKKNGTKRTNRIIGIEGKNI